MAKRLIPTKSSLDVVHFDEDGKPDGMVVRIEYEMKEVTDWERDRALETVEQILPVQRK